MDGIRKRRRRSSEKQNGEPEPGPMPVSPNGGKGGRDRVTRVKKQGPSYQPLAVPTKSSHRAS